MVTDEKIDVLINRTDNRSQEVARTLTLRWRWKIFFAAWTVFVVLAVWWLLQRARVPDINPSWFVQGDDPANSSLLQRIGNWFKLADLNFHQVYPWMLLAPYVAWLGSRFLLERSQWRVSLMAHLAGCFLFVAASHTLALYADWLRPTVVMVSIETLDKTDGKTGPAVKSGRTNAEIFTNTSWFHWGRGGTGPGFLAHAANGQTAGEGWMPPPGGPGSHRKMVARRDFLDSPLDLLNVLAYAGIVGLAQTVHFNRRSKERERRAAALEAQLTEARLRALQAQLHPHFLFNALNAISTLLLRDTRAAQEALASFSDLLRLALCHSTHPEVTLREDLEFLRRYVEIQQTRLGDRLRFEEVIPSDTLDYLVPALLLQPLVENAIRHGVEPSPNPGSVRVTVDQRGQRLVLTVEDDGAGLASKEDERAGNTGIGLQNLGARLKTLYGSEQKMEFGPRNGGGFVVTVEIPLRQSGFARLETSAA